MQRSAFTMHKMQRVELTEHFMVKHWSSSGTVCTLFAQFLSLLWCSCCCFASLLALASILACPRVHSSVHHFNYSIAIKRDKINIYQFRAECMYIVHTYSNPRTQLQPVYKITTTTATTSYSSICSTTWCGMTKYRYRLSFSMCHSCYVCMRVAPILRFHSFFGISIRKSFSHS